MKEEIFFIVRESLDGGYEANAVGYSIFTEGETKSELKENILEALECHFEAAQKPKIVRIQYINEEIIAA